jgi:integrase
VPNVNAGRSIGCTHSNRIIEDFHFHDLRHEFGSQLLESGGERHEVQATLGPTNIKMTRTYLNATTKSVEGAFKKLESKRRRQNLRVVR